MSKIDYQALREAAQLATQGEWVAFISSGTGTYAVHTPGDKRCEDVIKWTGFDGQNNAENNARYIAAFNPEVVQALLDERERNQQYIKSRDQENEDIALTVGKLRVELEAEKQRAKDLFMENARLKSGIAGLIHLGIRYADVDVMKIAGDAQLSTPCTDSIINSIATGIRINGGE
ncbi:TPA: ead/Ea22-like family protein [Escherichia coli]|uniref:ead/Ea22-like family protein n=1 Tax=Escherichia coli TaxID=562 RepID=UPI00122C4CB6|nr:ead/Ea22-like family protein [Escherichia coli]EFD7617690.1 ead/Ea22-like family protein [Escherichia coli]EHK7182802.1 ead/Ea22-like family protein [Escherichia coli]EIA6343292.1 ead/Ea22-like family protein [Escherichia coli]KAA1385331.1 ead/Ea22-like family protein [Escherichia coli]KAA1410175.1 ead/Ea22-like family protein [Escherichia coli]